MGRPQRTGGVCDEKQLQEAAPAETSKYWHFACYPVTTHI